jgi:hypothetical protein
MQRCPLCGGNAHPSPDTTPDQFGLTCPGPEADKDAQDFYVRLLAAAYLNLLVDEAQAYVDEVARRKKLWDERERTDVTQEELQADCDVRVAEKLPGRSVGHTEPFTADEGFDVDIPHLTVPGKVPRRPGLIQVRETDRTKPEDALLFMPDQEETPPEGGN